MVLFLLKSVHSKVACTGPFSARKKSNTISIGYSELIFHYTNAGLLPQLSLGAFNSDFAIIPLTAFRNIVALSVSFSVMSARYIISVISLLACSKSGHCLTHEPHEDDHRIFVYKLLIK